VGLVHQLMEARDERRLLKLQREGTPTALCRLLTGVTPTSEYLADFTQQGRDRRPGRLTR
jgi:hypothetical protein